MSVKSVDCLKKYEYLEGGLVVNEEARKLIAKHMTTQNPGGSSVKCCHHMYCWDYEYLYRDEAKDLVARRVLKMAVSEPPGTMFATRENCWVETLFDCFVADGTWGWGLKGILYLHDAKEEVGEEAQRVINLARSVAQFDESKAKVLKLTFKKGKIWRERCWDEYDVLYVGDVHSYCKYCLEPNLASDDIVAYVVLTSDGKLIPIATEEFKKYVW